MMLVAAACRRASSVACCYSWPQKHHKKYKLDSVSCSEFTSACLFVLFSLHFTFVVAFICAFCNLLVLYCLLMLYVTL